MLAKLHLASARRHIANLRAFRRMLASWGYPPDGACLRLPRFPPGDWVENPIPISPGRFATLPPPGSPKSVWDYALSARHELEGVPAAQLRALDVDDVDVESGTLRLTGSRGRKKLVVVSGSAGTGLRRWVAVRRVLGVRDPALFISLHWIAGRSQPGTRLSCRGVSEVLRRMRRELEGQG